MRHLILSGIVLAALIFALNVLARYVVEKYGFTAPDISFNFLSGGGPKYMILKGNYYYVYPGGRTEMINSSLGAKSLPVLTGVGLEEERPGHKAALKQALALHRKYLGNISEINMSNPDNIIIIDNEGRRVFAGGDLTNEVMENYHIALSQINRPYRVVDLRYADRVIIR